MISLFLWMPPTFFISQLAPKLSSNLQDMPLPLSRVSLKFFFFHTLINPNTLETKGGWINHVKRTHNDNGGL